MAFRVSRGWRILRRSALAALVVALACARPAAAQEPPPEEVVDQVAVNLYFPPDKTVVDKYDVPVEGVVLTPGVEDFGVVVNDGRPQRFVVRDGTFADTVSLDPGLNVIRIGSVERRVWLAVGSTKPPAEYQKVYGHFGLSDGCLECHELDRQGRFALAGDREEICTWCHGDMVWGVKKVPWASVHAPIKAGRCLLCHTPHFSTKKNLPADAPPTCASCHRAVLERLKTDRFTHGPMNVGDCRLCHTVHSSSQPKLLARPATSLCTDCHSETLSFLKDPKALRPHTLIPEGKCGRCHEPHSSPNQRLLRQPAGRLCQECHEGKTRSFHESKGFSIYICAKCHELHRPSLPHLIIEESRGLCTECHDFKGEAVFTHSFVEEGKCFLCHGFHESALSAETSALCLGCHRDNPLLPRAHHRIPYEKSTCTICHQPHKSPAKKLLRAKEHTPFKERKCDPCHRDRVADIGPVLAPLCTSCHRNKSNAAIVAAATATVHPPFKEKDCSGCHGSHNADAPNLLREPEGDLCLNCHRKMRKTMLLTPVSSHDDVLKGRCGSCHDPHWSPNALLLKEPPAALCQSCHGAVVLGPGGSAWPVKHKPVDEGKCRSCHRHHISANPKLLKQPATQVCRTCHAAFFAAIDAPAMISRHAPVKKGDCAVCHDLHGGDRLKLVKAGVNEALCRGCHPKANVGAHHSFSETDARAREVLAAVGERRCTHCHLVHASEEPRLTVSRKGPVCGACHKGQIGG